VHNEEMTRALAANKSKDSVIEDGYMKAVLFNYLTTSETQQASNLLGVIFKAFKFSDWEQGEVLGNVRNNQQGNFLNFF
jgi:hypothetical protein